MLKKLIELKQSWHGLTFVERIVIYLFGFSCVYSIIIITAGWWRPILDFHGFRQTQTAISTYYLLKGGPWLAYQTPVLGPPWSIPFEFPLYQWIVAILVKLFGTSLDQTGRFVSVVFFYATLLPLNGILRLLLIKPLDRLLLLTMVLVSPLYLFWSRTFMIESTVLFLSMSYLYCYFQSDAKQNNSLLYIASCLGILAALVKITTFYGFAIVAFFYLLYRLSRENKPIAYVVIAKKYITQATLLFLLPLIAVLWWTHFADSYKQQNMLAHFIVSSHLTKWNFGSISQRFSASFWDATLFNRIIPDIVGNKFTFVALAILLLAGLGNRQYRWHVLFCLLAFLLVPLTFTNLHIIHDYYEYANGIFLIAAIGFAVLGVANGQRFTWLSKILAMLVFVISAVYGYQVIYIQRQLHADRKLFMQTSADIKQLTRPDDLVIIYGYDWHPGLLYYSDRRGIMMRAAPDPDGKKFQEIKQNIKNYTIGAVVVCRKPYLTNYMEVLADLSAFGVATNPVAKNRLCAIYVR